MGRPQAVWKQLVVSGLIAAGAVGIWFAPDEIRQLVPLLSVEAVPDNEQRTRSRAHPVIVAPVGRARDDVTIEIVGTGRAVRSVSLRSEASGRIVKLAIEPNRNMSRGDVLLALEDREEQLSVQLWQTRLAEAKRVKERARSLMDRGVVADARITEVETAASVAQLELERALEVLDDRTLRAPFDGVSGIPLVEEGAWIDSDTDIATFDDRSVILVEFDLPQAALARVRTGLTVEASTPVQPGRIFSGSVTEIDSRIDAASRTARVRVTIPNRDDELRPGASFTIKLDLPGSEYFVVPELALLFAREGLHVWRILEDKAERVPVTLVRRRNDMVLVDGALHVDDVVVVEGTQRLRTGGAVNVIGTRAEGPV
ncbi:MAG: efflux RND transporter periplasmic adaptor subunit [Pseudomonadota bacterium]